MRSRRESITTNGNGYAPFAPITRQNSFLSPLDSEYYKRNPTSSRSSLVRSPDRTSNKDNKRRRLSLLPKNTGSLGAPRLLHQRPPTVTNFTNNLTNTHSSLRNVTANIPVQQMVQNSMSRTKLPMQRAADKYTRPPSSSNRYDTPPVSTNRLYSKPKSIDPRPLRSHKFQSKLQDELYEYLSTNKYDIEMKTQISQRTLKAPAQKDFVLMFQWLYKKLDPGYKFNRSIEQDVYMLLKFLEYPYLENINKSQISAVGGENWHTFLGMLHWMMELVKESTKLDDLDLDSIQESQKQSQTNDTGFSDDQYILNKLFINYALKSYKAFLSDGDEDYSEFYEDMQKEYKRYIDDIQRRNATNIEINDNLQEALNNLNEKHNLFLQHLEKGAALSTDVQKFRDYIETQKRRQLQWPDVLNKINSDLESVKDSIKNLAKEKNDHIADLEVKQLTLKDIEDLHKERARLTAELNTIDHKQHSTRKSVEIKLQTLSSLFNDLMIKVNTYNNEMYSILNDINLQLNPDAKKLIIGSLDEELRNSKLGMQTNEIIPLLPTLRSELSVLKSTIQTNLNTVQEEVMKQQNLVGDLELSISSDADKVDELEELLSNSRRELSDLKENFKTESLNKDLEIKERTKEISLFKLQAAERKKSVESNWLDTQRDHKMTISDIQEQRKQLTFKIAASLDSIVNFKSEVFEDLENAVIEAKNEAKEQLELISKSTEEEPKANDFIEG